MIATSQEIDECDVDTNTSATPPFPRVLVNGASTTFVINETSGATDCNIGTLADGQKVKIDLEIKWYSTRSTAAFTHTAKGSLLANVE